jgi:glyoxylase-like metal-dependent hydrolase (beta-lactamase superfamily II)
MIDIIPVDYGKSSLPESWVYQNGSEEKKLPIIFRVYLLKTENRLILVDAGCETMPGFDMKDFIGPVKALNNIGISPEEITDLIITHAHHDHIESASLYQNATFYLQQEEYQKGKKYLPPEAEVILFQEEITPLPGILMRRIGGHSEGSCIIEIGKTVIAGDECYTRRNLLEKIPTGTSKHPDRSRAFIEQYSDPEYQVLLCHEA